MAKVRVMYWKEIPVQVQAADEHGMVTRRLDDRFQAGVDAIAMFDGSQGSDAYLDGWSWGPPREVPGAAAEVATALADRYNARFPRDFVVRIRWLHESGTRNPQPGAVDYWLDEGE